MRNRNTTNRITIKTVRKSDIDQDRYEYMDAMISQLKSMLQVHEIYCMAPDMISYHIKRAIEYCERAKIEAVKRVKIDED